MLLFSITSGSPAAQGDAEPQPEPAQLRVTGFGLIQNRQLTKLIRQLQPAKAPPLTFNANYIEDAALILLNRLTSSGYLQAEIVAEIQTDNQSTLHHSWRLEQRDLLPRPLAARSVRFRARKGILFYYHTLNIRGLKAIDPEEASGYFYKRDFLLPLKTPSRYTPDRLRGSLQNLQMALQNLGYRDAVVTADRVDVDPASGKVEVDVKTVPGPLYLTRSVEIVVRSQPDADILSGEIRLTHERYSPIWEQDLRQQLANAQFALGYADTEVTLHKLGQTLEPDRILVDLRAEVVRGPLIKLGQVRFEGYKHTRLSLLQRRARVQGPELNRIEVDRGREKLSRLGIFKSTDVRYEPKEGSPRDVVYDLEEGRRIDVNLLAGYGSYDLAFGGVELNQYNLFGIGHTHRLRLIQSFKSSIGDYAYTVPEFFARDLSLFATTEGLRREEISFDREELILSLGVRKAFPRLGSYLGLRYAYEFLKADRAPALQTALSPTEVAAFIIDAQRERRDNPLLPRKGYRLYASVEIANRAYGGEASYQRVELNASWHRPLGGGRYLHLNLTHGLAISDVAPTDLPFNKRFFPGGDSSIRGYQRGEASPLNQFGYQIGAESVLIWNVELEQALAPTWSVVAFVDGAGITETIENYPFDDVLWSVGGGLRWNTVIGPVRLEYGYNLNPRFYDPTGTLHFSIGYPF